MSQLILILKSSLIVLGIVIVWTLIFNIVKSILEGEEK